MSGKRSRTKGHAFERAIVNRLKEYWPHACTSRAESKNLDDKGVDICYTDPFSVQCKAVEKLSPGVHDILRSMPDDDNYNVVAWKRNNKGTVICMELDDFMEIVQMLKKEKVI